MCYKLSHTCIYCSNEYDCFEVEWICPTINGDENRNMCDSCHDKLEIELQKYIDEHGRFPRVTIKELLDD